MLPPPERDLMLQATALALEAVHGGKGGPFGALVAKYGRVIATGTNCVTSANDPTAHAEIVAIRAACAALGDFRLTGCELYSSCEPCPMCLSAAFWARVDRIVYAGSREDAARAGFDDAFFYEQLARPPDWRKIPMTPFMRESAQEAFDAWLAKDDRTAY